MTTHFITTFFTTLAQVSFTLAGLMAIAVAGDSKRRDYWFNDDSHSLFIRICFLLLLLPGLVSIGGLIPPFSETSMPSWPIPTFLISLIYLIFSISFHFGKRKIAESEKFKRLVKTYPNAHFGMRIYNILMILLAEIGYSAYHHYIPTRPVSIEIFLGAVLFISIFTSAFNSVKLLMVNKLSTKDQEETNIQSPPKETIIVVQEDNTSRYILLALLIGIISFLFGLFVKRKSE